MRTSFSWRLLDTRLVQTLSAEYSALPTAGKRGQKFCLKMKTPAGSMWFLIRTIRTLFSLHCGRLGGSPGFFPAAGRGSALAHLKRIGLPWNGVRAKGCAQEVSGRAGNPFPGPVSNRVFRRFERE